MNLSPVEVFRRATSFLYRGIGVLRKSNHREVFEERDTSFGFFEARARKEIARQLYRETRDIDDPARVLARYEEKSGLTLEDIQLAFEEGDWRSASGGIYYGGPKWAEIARRTIQLRDAIMDGDKQRSREVATALMQLPNNTGILVEKFREL